MDGWRREYGSEKRNALDHELKALLDEFLRRKEADDKEGALLKVRHILEKLVENIFVLEGLAERFDEREFSAKNLAERIDFLYSERALDYTSKNNYHAIRMAANKAAHNQPFTDVEYVNAVSAILAELEKYSEKYDGRTVRAKKKSTIFSTYDRVNDAVNQLFDDLHRLNFRIRRKFTTVWLIICIPFVLYILISGLVGFRRNMKAFELVSKRMMDAASNVGYREPSRETVSANTGSKKSGKETAPKTAGSKKSGKDASEKAGHGEAGKEPPSPDAGFWEFDMETASAQTGAEIQSNALDETAPEASPEEAAGSELESDVPAWVTVAVDDWKSRYQSEFFEDAFTIKMNIGETVRVRNIWSNCEYYSTDTGVIEVDSQGNVTAVGEGVAFVAIKTSIGGLIDCERYEVS